MKVRIENDGQQRYATKITDAETGKELEHVTSAIIQFDAKEDVPTAILFVHAPVVDVIADAEIKHVCPCCGREKDIPLIPIQSDATLPDDTIRIGDTTLTGIKEPDAL